ncbi:hypothetical protein DN820_14485 [Stutzerimonas nosocomialis]|uniref:Zinc-ribbon domain-containing protein n=1 Tax=Stutzerimonas nosocomialis TaxID=1056496 RepID=A0A5R9QD41_9GAMM|nr:putative zinc-binding peptidase [Stutzerimonas nosocomialis]TLX62818.1 hypothetical protein DN820_14485 [Stutzerimonas nosocomialis]
MDAFFTSLSRRLNDAAHPLRAVTPRIDQCTCGQPVYFGNSACLVCQSALGYVPERGRLATLRPGSDNGTWRLAEDPQSPSYRRCANLDSAAGCNWLLPAGGQDRLCLACRLTRVIPDLSVEGNDLRWRKLEAAKRRLVAQLLALGLPVVPKRENERDGLAFEFLGTDTSGRQPMTGHASGVITLNIAEADDARREEVRVQMHEPYRTLLGHFRHEVGHYYWDRLIADGPWLEPFRQLFGDEREDYGQALQRHYDDGPTPGWQTGYISAYATMHPWEDWAETWAHYLHMMDTLDTALSFGMRAAPGALELVPFTRAALYDPDDPEGDAFLNFINAWIELAAMLNELARSMGQPDLYPFVLPAAAIGKLQFVHRVIQAGRPLRGH